MTANTETLPDQEHHEHEEHVLPLWVYFAVFGALMVLTAVTVGVSMLDLGKPAIIVAMIVAIIKASLVSAYFMHLKYDAGFNSLIFIASLLFLAIFFVLTLLDLGSRGDVMQEQDNFELKTKDAAKDRKALIKGGGDKATPLEKVTPPAKIPPVTK